MCPALNTELPNNIVYKKLSLLEVILPDPQQWSLCIYVQRTRVQLVKLSAILGITYILYMNIKHIFAKVVFIEIISPVLHIPIIVTHLVTHSLKIYTLCIMHISLMIQNDVLHIFLATNMYFILIFRY